MVRITCVAPHMIVGVWSMVWQLNEKYYYYFSGMFNIGGEWKQSNVNLRDCVKIIINCKRSLLT